jgi:predicted ferric reductase
VKRIALPLSLLIVVLWAALQPMEILSFSAPFLTMRKALTLLTGALAIGWMGFCMVLALRPAWLERRLGGLDKLFRVHKWAGIGAVVLVITHWLLILSPRTLMAWGWVEKVVRNHRPHGPGGESLVGLAKEMGEWSAWIMIILGIVALLRSVPYGWFRKLHKGFPIAFLIGAFHSVIMLRDGMATTPFGLMVIAIALAGSVIAVQSLAGMVGRSRRHAGRVSGVTVTAAGVLDLHVSPGSDWPGHQAGQFALLTLDRQEGPHPFTIASDWKPGAPLRFAIKPLGDYTRTLARRVKVGDALTVEGPYGRFDFGDVAEEQVWVAGGIGVAPFLARLEWLAAAGGAQGEVHFFYSVKRVADASFPVGLQDLCRRAGVELHLRIDDTDGQIDSGEIGKFVRKARGVWFCGPPGWARMLQRTLQQDHGLLPGRFHREIFEFR